MEIGLPNILEKLMNTTQRYHVAFGYFSHSNQKQKLKLADFIKKFRQGTAIISFAA